MTAYARPSGREQIVPLNPAQNTVAAGRPAFDRLCTGSAEIGDGACLEFAASRRTGNIEITLTDQSPQQGTTDQTSGGASAEAEDGPNILGSRPKPHAAMPEATGDFCGDLHAFGTEVPATVQDGTIENLMARTGKGPGARQRVSGPAGRGGVDVRLTQIIEAWPQLPARTRADMIALLGRGGQRGEPASELADRPPTLRPVRVKQNQAKDGGGGRRRGPRKSANPPS